MKRLAVAVASICLAMGTTLAPVAQSATGLAPDLTSKASEFRRSFGLQADAAYVALSVADRTSFPDDRFGVPLTQAEGAEIQRRVDVQLAVTPAAEWASAQPDFAGWYIDQLAGGTPVVEVAGDVVEFANGFSKHLAGAVEYRIVAVKNTQQSLQALEDGIWADRAGLAKDGIDVQGVALDIPKNMVQVEVAGLTDQTAKALELRYGSIEVVGNVSVEPDVCNSRLDCAPPKSGIEIVNVQHPGSLCTAGFNVQLVSTGARRILTAGHCLTEAPSVLGNGWSHHGVQLGTAEMSLWANGGNYDVGLITQPSIPGDDNLIYWSSNTDVPHVIAIASLAGQSVGTVVCRSAVKSGYWCGKVTLIEQIKDVDGRSIHHMWVVNFDAIPGDSGAPYGVETAPDRFLAFGTHSDSTSANPPGGSAWYAPLVYSLTGLRDAGFHVTVCTLTTC
jgi:V8-like Glu-specific endopeptidase